METTKEIRRVNGKKYMTINAIAEISGIARDSLTNRFYRFKKEYPEHTYHFGSKIPVYYDEYVLHLLVESTRIRPIRVIEDMDKYEKFYKTYKSKAYEAADAEQTDFIINFKPGNPIPLGVGRKGSFFTKKIKKSLIFLLSPEKSSILNTTEQKSIKSAERRRANGSKRAKCNDIHKGKTIS